jgi:hypothetical protein
MKEYVSLITANHTKTGWNQILERCVYQIHFRQWTVEHNRRLIKETGLLFM